MRSNGLYLKSKWRFFNGQANDAQKMSSQFSYLISLIHVLVQRQTFLRNWFDDEVILQVSRGEKRSCEEMNEGAGVQVFLGGYIICRSEFFDAFDAQFYDLLAIYFSLSLITFPFFGNFIHRDKTRSRSI